MHKLILIALLSVVSSIAYADVCPSVQELKSGKSNQWKAYDSDNDKPLTAARESRLKKILAKFAMAEWADANHKSVIHCYYKDKHGSAMEAYFSKDSALPIKPSKYWYQVTGMMQCAASADQCQFQMLPNATHQLASASKES